VKCRFFLSFLILVFPASFSYGTTVEPHGEGDLVFRDSGFSIYGRDTTACLNAARHPGHVGIFIGKNDDGENEIIHALGDPFKFGEDDEGWPIKHGGEIVITPLGSTITPISNKLSFYFDDEGKKSGNPLGAKAHRNLLSMNSTQSQELRDDIVRYAKNQEGELYDENLSHQKGTDSQQWTCVGFTEKAYEVNGLDITPDGFYLEDNTAVCHFQNSVEFSQLALYSPIGRLNGAIRFVFFPWTQFNQPTLIDSFEQPEPTTGFIDVSSGVNISPSSVILGQNFNISFKLKEYQGAQKTFEKIALAILRDNDPDCPDGLCYDVKIWENVTFDANQEISFSENTYLYTSRSTGWYKAIVRGKLEGGNWFDFGVVPGSGATNPNWFYASSEGQDPPDDPPDTPSGNCDISIETVEISESGEDDFHHEITFTAGTVSHLDMEVKVKNKESDDVRVNIYYYSVISG
jgi:hypothetical protein